jgi:nicotinate-nucleotide pyrophosphorylase (carboxylating)
MALAEDLDSLGDRGDLTSRALIDPSAKGRAHFIARTCGVVAGVAVAAAVFHRLDPSLEVGFVVNDATVVQPGQRLGSVTGSERSILTAERTALNFLQRLSGVATLTRRFVDAIAGLPCRILDTRKTTPGWRHLEKHAVRCGGGANHRMGLFDAILIKDNHLAALSHVANPIGEAISRARKAVGVEVPIEVEVCTLEQLGSAIAARPDRILLDNMPLEMLAAAVRQRNAAMVRIPLEASGGVTLATVRAIAETGVDFISVGALTHSASALDIALDYET